MKKQESADITLIIKENRAQKRLSALRKLQN